VEFKKGSLSAPFIKPGDEKYSRDDELIITEKGRIEVVDRELKLEEIQIESVSYGVNVEVFDFRDTSSASMQEVTREVSFTVSSANTTVSGSQQTTGTTHTIGVEVGVAAKVKNVELSAKASYEVVIKDELVKKFEQTISSAAAGTANLTAIQR